MIPTLGNAFSNFDFFAFVQGLAERWDCKLQVVAIGADADQSRGPPKGCCSGCRATRLSQHRRLSSAIGQWGRYSSMLLVPC